MRALVLLLLPALAWAHGGQPQARHLHFAPQFPDTVFAATDTQGLYIGGPRGDYRWLCEDAVAPLAGVRFATPIGAGQTRWLVGAEEGLFLTEDRGCGFEATLAEPLAGNRAVAADRHPERPDEVLVATDGFGRPNDVWRSVDGGAHWTPAGLEVIGALTGLLRSEADPDVVYVSHVAGAGRSTDGGQSFSRIKLGPAGTDVAPEAFVLLAAPASDRDLVFAAAERLGGTLLMRSADGGQTWRTVATIHDFPLTVAFDAAGRAGLLTTPIEAQAWRTDDAGETWRPGPTPVARLGCLTRQPGTDRLWGCTNVFFGGPWALGHSDDFGRTWTPALVAWPDVVGRWPCTRESDTRACCQHLCPGLAAGADCPDRRPQPGPTCPEAPPLPDQGVPEPDAGPPPDRDAEPTPEIDASPTPTVDAAVTDDAEPPPELDATPRDQGAQADAAPATPDAGGRTQPGGGCRQGPPLAPWLLGLLLLALRPRRGKSVVASRR